MEAVYIRFDAPPPTLAEGPLKRLVKNLAERVIPKANPQFERALDHVRYWLIECDAASGIPQREIGLDAREAVIVRMPLNEDYGYWTDNNLMLEDFKRIFEVTEITHEYFERQWTSNEERVAAS
jgi:hypothetical protein